MLLAVNSFDPTAHGFLKEMGNSRWYAQRLKNNAGTLNLHYAFENTNIFQKRLPLIPNVY